MSIILPVRIGINSKIGYKSMQLAILEKNEQYALRVASFIRSTYSSNNEAGQRAFDLKMIDYYREIKDTLNYFLRSVTYYDNNYMTVNVDSIKKKDSLNLKMLLENATVTATDRSSVIKTVTYGRLVQKYSRELNNVAYSFYEITNNPLHLSKALEWSARSNEFFETYTSLDTYAHLLYKTGKKEEAILWQTKAISLKQKQRFDPKDLESSLNEMKKGK